MRHQNLLCSSLIILSVTTFTDIEALSLQAWICMQYWATRDVVKLFIIIETKVYEFKAVMNYG